MTAQLIPDTASGGGFGWDAQPCLSPTLTWLRLTVPGKESSSDGKNVTQVISGKKKENKKTAKYQQNRSHLCYKLA